VTADPDVYDHLRPTDTAATSGDHGSAAATSGDHDGTVATSGDHDGAGVEPGVYRVVGTGDPVTLLRVGDADGRRVTTGETVHVDRADLAAFEVADNPDGNRPAADRLASLGADLALQVWAFWRGLRARPLAALAAAAAMVVGHQGDRVLPGPDVAFTAVYMAGALALVVVGARNG